MAGPLNNIRVLDLSRILAGPWAGQTLADMGADVIKVERPGLGDDTRQWGPPYLKNAEGQETTESAYYLSANRGKQSITLNFTKPEGKAILLELIGKADVLIENYKVGGLKKYGLDYESLKDLNPRLIYCSITGFGQTGPYANRSGYDFLIQGMGGLMSITGEASDTENSTPQKVGVALTDIMTGLYASIAILGALNHRRDSGMGQHIDMALLDVQVAVLANQAMNYLTSGTPPHRIGNAHPNIVPYQAFATADGHIILAIGNDEQFARFCSVAQCPHLAEDHHYTTNPKRVENRKTLIALLEPILKTRSSAKWIADLETVKVPCGPINTLDNVFSDAQVCHREMKFTLEHPLAGETPQVKTPISYSATPLSYELAPPLLGEHTKSLLEEYIGLTEKEIETLRHKGVI